MHPVLVFCRLVGLRCNPFQDLLQRQFLHFGRLKNDFAVLKGGIETVANADAELLQQQLGQGNNAGIAAFADGEDCG